ncbi:hypothetical protein [Cellulomonas fimi]|uniref:Uncharacterized protein n=1 Tax=Cellulomonas fimi TaxID=1708 RepID=A0A7Y0QIQ5_CELFI|nr:hypothetical protein [Cellulomonas fimi]NMR20552.1 hypothetical protein [Cellulomonas fimi]
MPTRLLLDGEDLASLVRRVCAEMGPDAVIVKAERVRTGGIGGFFAKEHFELTVEVPEPRPRIPRRRPVVAPAPGPAAAPAVGLSALIDAADAAEVHDAAPRVSTDAATFASVLASIDDMADVPGGAHAGVEGRLAATPVVEHQGARRIEDLGVVGAAGAAGPVGAAVSAVDATAVAGVDAGATPGGEAAGAPALPPARFAPRGAVVTPVAFDPIRAGIPTQAGAPESGATEPAGAADEVGAAEEAGAADEVGGTDGSGASAAAGAVGPGPGSTSAATPDGAPRPPDGAPRPPGGDRRALLALGVPSALLGDGPLDEPLPLSSLLASMTRPPTLLRTSGAIVAVVGEKAEALAVATQMAGRLRLDPHDVVLAGEMQPVAGHGRRLLSPSAAARYRARVTDGEQVSIVALGVGPGAEDRRAAAELLAELGADQTWAVLDARRKAADLRAWMAAVGGAVAGGGGFDAVAAASVHETQEPGTVLGLGTPVGWIDGLPATPVVWAALLSERLGTGAHWD